MARDVCFITKDGEVGTCPYEGDCVNCYFPKSAIMAKGDEDGYEYMAWDNRKKCTKCGEDLICPNCDSDVMIDIVRDGYPERG